MNEETRYQWFERAPTPATLDFHATYTAQLRTKHPGLFSAPQPAALPPVTEKREPNPVHPFAAIREQAAAGTYRLRDPAASTAGLIPTASVGTCLAPVFQDRDTLWYDTSVVPQSGDFVAVTFTPEAFQYIADFHRHKYGSQIETLSPFAGKLLRNERGVWLLLSSTGSIPLESATVCGVLRRVERHGAAIYA